MRPIVDDPSAYRTQLGTAEDARNACLRMEWCNRSQVADVNVATRRLRVLQIGLFAVAEKCASGAGLERKIAKSLKKMVGAGGFELPTSCSQSKCSTRLSYAPISIIEMLSGVLGPIRQASNQHVHRARGNRTIERLDLGPKRPWMPVRTLFFG